MYWWAYVCTNTCHCARIVVKVSIHLSSGFGCQKLRQKHLVYLPKRPYFCKNVRIPTYLQREQFIFTWRSQKFMCRIIPALLIFRRMYPSFFVLQVTFDPVLSKYCSIPYVTMLFLSLCLVSYFQYQLSHGTAVWDEISCVCCMYDNFLLHHCTCVCP